MSSRPDGAARRASLPLWRVAIGVPHRAAAAIEAVLEPDALALSAFEAEADADFEPRADDLCVVEALYGTAPEPRGLTPHKRRPPKQR